MLHVHCDFTRRQVPESTARGFPQVRLTDDNEHAHQSADVRTVCIITPTSAQHTLPSPSHNTFVSWVQSRVFVALFRLRLHLRLQHRLRLCPRPRHQLGQRLQHRPHRLRFHYCPQFCLPYLRFRTSQKSSSECSSLGEQMRGKLLFYRGSARQRRVRRSTGLVRRALEIWYALIPNASFNLMVNPGRTRIHDRGWRVIFF